jgi:hypothetical protein
MRMLGWMVAGGMVAAAAGLAAQQAKPTEQAERDRLTKLADQVMVEMAAQLNACPVGFHAEVDPRLTLRQVQNGKQAADSTLVQLHFDPIEPKKAIVSASVTAHGFAPASAFLLVQQTLEDNRTQAFELKGGSSTAGLVRTEVDVTAVPFVRWVELNQVTYADGSVWHPAAGLACKARLSKFHYVSAR